MSMSSPTSSWAARSSGGGAASQVVLESHTGQRARHVQSLVDEHGRLFLVTDLGLGVVHTLDMPLAADMVEAGAWQPREVMFADLAARYGHVLSPQSRLAPARA